MTNREKLNRMAMYDLLVSINEGLDREINNAGCATCVIELLGTKIWSSLDRRCNHYETCKDCIASWLNEEVKE